MAYGDFELADVVSRLGVGVADHPDLFPDAPAVPLSPPVEGLLRLYFPPAIANGTEKPHDIRMWCLGNEMDGPWQTGYMTADDYGKLAARTAQAMKAADKDLELVVCGSSGSSMPTFGDWERTVLEHSYEHVDFISCHAYYQERGGDLASYLASSIDMQYFIETVVATGYRASTTTPGRLRAMASAALRPGALRDHLGRADVVHYPLTVPVPPVSGPTVVTLLDVQHLDLPQLFPRGERLFRRLAYDRGSRRAAQVVVIS